MKIDAKLDIDNDIEVMPSGELAHASNIIVNNTNDAVLTENGIKLFYGLDEEEEIVGRIACSDEFVIFTSKSRILRVNEITNNIREVQTNWQWQGGEVIGCYTYNARKDLLIAISERIDYEIEKVPLKIINLDYPNYHFGTDDNNYTVMPDIPQINLVGYEFIGGDFIDKGVYIFFIRYKKGEDYTQWFNFGYPINVFNTDNSVCIEEVWYAYQRRDHQEFGTFRYDEMLDDDAKNVSKNIMLSLQINRLNTDYDYFQIGYIVTTIDNETKTYLTKDYDINVNNVIIDCKTYVDEEVSVDDLTAVTFNIFNAKTICNYNNRVYLANYHEENPNIDIENLNISGIEVEAVSYIGQSVDTQTLSNSLSINTLSDSSNNVVAKATNAEPLANEEPVTRAKEDDREPTNSQGIFYEEAKNGFVEYHVYAIDFNISYLTIDKVKVNTTITLVGVAEKLSNGLIGLKFTVASFHAIVGYKLNIPVVSLNSLLDTTKNSDYDSYFGIWHDGKKYVIGIGNCVNNVATIDNITFRSNEDSSLNLHFGNNGLSSKSPDNDYYLFFESDSYPNNSSKITIGKVYDLNVQNIINSDNYNKPFDKDYINPAYYYTGAAEVDGNVYDVYINSTTARSYPYLLGNSLLNIDTNNYDYYRNYYNTLVINTVNSSGGINSYNDIVMDKLASNLGITKEQIIDDYNIYFETISLDNLYNEIPSGVKMSYNISELFEGINVLVYPCITYDILTKTFKFGILLFYVNNVAGNGYKNLLYTIGFTKCTDTVILEKKDDLNSITYTVQDLFPEIEYHNNRQDTDIQQLVDYLVDGNDPNGDITFEPTANWQWTEDIEPSATDYIPGEKYNLVMNQVKVNSDNTINAANPYTGKLYNQTAIAVGYKNYVYGNENDDTVINTVDKSFCVCVPLYNMVSAMSSSGTGYDIASPLKYAIDEDSTTFEGDVEQYYILFDASSTVNINNENCVVGKLCKLQDDSSINDTIPRFDYIADITSVSFNDDYPALINDTLVEDDETEEGEESDETILTICVKHPFYYASNITTESIYEDIVYATDSEYQKVAINHSVYSFFIHYVYANGSITDGLPIVNKQTYEWRVVLGTAADGTTCAYTCNENTTPLTLYTYIEDTIANHGAIEFDDKLEYEYGLLSMIASQNTNRICNLIPRFNDKGIALYINNNGDRLFRGSSKGKSDTGNSFGDYNRIQNFIDPIKFIFRNIPKPDKFVGYFISYEKTEPIMLGRGYYRTMGNNGYNNQYPQKDSKNAFDSVINSIRFDCPEYNILKQYNNINLFYQEEQLFGGKSDKGYLFTDAFDIICNSYADREVRVDGSAVGFPDYYSKQVFVTNSSIIIPDDLSFDNYGRESSIEINTNTMINNILGSDYECAFFTPETIVKQIDAPTSLFNFGYSYFEAIYNSVGIAMSIKDNIYCSNNKQLIPLGKIEYYNGSIGNDGTYGADSFPYNYDYYNNKQIPIIIFNPYGVIYDEINAIPTYATIPTDEEYLNYDNSEDDVLYPINKQITISEVTRDVTGTISGKMVVGYESNPRQGHAPITRLRLNSYNLFDIRACQIDNAPVEKVYTLYDKYILNAADKENADVKNVHTIYIYPRYVNDLIKYPSCYKEFSNKLYTNFDEEEYSNYISYYDRTIRRSEVMGDESIENRWRIFKADAYKVIQENKGSIMNVVGVGRYLLAHCEHSLFIFDRTNKLGTEDMDVQMVVPDTFDIDYTEVFPTDKGFGGLQGFHHWCVSNYGYIFLDKDSKKVYRFDDNKLDELTPGMYNLFMHINDAKFGIDYENNRAICIGSLTTDEKFTISYHFDSKAWISTHSYWYEDIFNTKLNTYFIIDNTIHTFDKSIYNNYTNIIDDSQNFFKNEIYDSVPYSYIDVIFNNSGIDKVLDYISYRINKATDDQYSGDKLLIYTNCCYSDYKDITTPRRRVNDWKNPVYRYGIWVVNWFRNMIKPIPTVHPIIRGNGKFDPNTGELGKQVNNNALMVGKYWVVRLIFGDRTRRISVDDVQTY